MTVPLTPAEVTVTGWRFTLVDSSGRMTGAAVVCPDARYASVLWVGSERLDRRRLAGTDWPGVTASLMLVPMGDWVPKESPVSAALSGDTGARVRLMGMGLVSASPTTTAQALDDLLRQFSDTSRQ